MMITEIIGLPITRLVDAPVETVWEIASERLEGW
jgi:hypothetical protein